MKVMEEHEIASAVYEELLENRAHLLTDDYVKEFESIFLRLYSSLNKLDTLITPDFRRKIRNIQKEEYKYSKVTRDQVLKKQLGLENSFEKFIHKFGDSKISFIHQDFGVTFQQIDKDDMTSMEVALESI